MMVLRENCRCEDDGRSSLVVTVTSKETGGLRKWVVHFISVVTAHSVGRDTGVRLLT